VDANEYQKWHLDYKFNLLAAASITNHKCDNYASKNKSLLDLYADDLHNKSIWMFTPLELAQNFLLHYEAIRLQQPDSMIAGICLPRLVTPGSDYKSLVKKYTCIHTYPAGTYLFSKFVHGFKHVILKYMFKSKRKEDIDITTDYDEEQIQFKPHQLRFITPLCHVTTSRACDDLHVIQAPTNQDIHLKALVDSGATNFFCSSRKYPPH